MKHNPNLYPYLEKSPQTRWPAAARLASGLRFCIPPSRDRELTSQPKTILHAIIASTDNPLLLTDRQILPERITLDLELIAECRSGEI